jgi:hypothetical protein
LISALKSSNPIIRGNAATFLAGKDATLAIPALILVLDDEYYPRHLAADSLGRFGPAAKSAAPKLLSVYTNIIAGSDKRLAGDTGISLLEALRKIDPASAGEAETFLVNSGPLNGARSGYTRTKLTNGMELIAGGYIHTEIPTVNNRQLSSAELYDPATGKWTETGEMNTARYNHTAVLQPDGKVLVTGGYGSHSMNTQRSALSSAEVYDPVTGKWTPTGSMNYAHYNNYTMTVLPDGKVLLVQGHSRSAPLSKELYDPATGKWTVITNK